MAKRKLNLLDAVIIFILIAGVVYAGLKYGFLPSETKVIEGTKVVYTIEVVAADEELVKAVSVGDPVSVGVNGVSVSRVADVKYEDATSVAFNKIDGKYENVNIIGKYNLKVKFEGRATVTQIGINVDDTPIRVGTMLTAKGKGYAVTGYVLTVDLVE